jgi:hypothetical protein
VDNEQPLFELTDVPEITWPCEAYGERGLALGALCFVSGAQGVRTCIGPEQCFVEMMGARLHVYNRMCQKALEGDETAQYLITVFKSPWGLLGGRAPLLELLPEDEDPPE